MKSTSKKITLNLEEKNFVKLVVPKTLKDKEHLQ